MRVCVSLCVEIFVFLNCAIRRYEHEHTNNWVRCEETCWMASEQLAISSQNNDFSYSATFWLYLRGNMDIGHLAIEFVRITDEFDFVS